MVVEELGGELGSDTGAAALIESVGVEAFPAALFRTLHGALECEHISAFVFAPTATPSLLLAEDVRRSGTAASVGTLYATHFWRLDPVNALIIDHPARANRAGRFLVEMSASEIDDGGYRSRCYTDPELATRVSILERRAARTLKFNIYHRTGFSQAARERLMSMTGLLLPLLWRHSAPPAATRPISGPRDWISRVETLRPRLTRRESQVCTLIVTGVSSEGIGIELGLSRNTVLTYRKRAYARLGITSENELLRLVLH